MKVKELIELLQKEDPERRVVVAGYEGGYDDIGVVEQIQLKLNARRENGIFGCHEADKDGECRSIHLGV